MRDHYKTLLLSIILLLGIASIAIAQKQNKMKENVDETTTWKLYREVMGGDAGWQKVEDKNGIQIYTRKTKVSPVKAFRGVTEFKADLQTMAAFLADGTTYPSYIYLCNSAEVLKNENDGDLYLHSINKPPFIYTRDSVTHTLWTYDRKKNIAILDCIGVPGLIPEIEKSVRVPLIFIQVYLIPKENGIIKLTFEGVCEPGGLIPSWVANFCIKQTPRATLRNLIDKRPFEKFNGKTVSFIPSTPAGL